MMNYRIDLFERFGVCSVILPYVGQLHSAFLMLSKLSVKSRKMLDKYIKGILNWMDKNVITLVIWDQNGGMLHLPSDLFWFSINIDSETTLKYFLLIIENISVNKGYYFNDHFMHKRLWITKLKIKPNLTVKMYPYLKLLENTSVIVCLRINYRK